MPFKILLAIIALGIGTCYGIRYMVYAAVETELPRLLQDLEQKNIKAKITSIKTSWYKNRIELEGVSLLNEEPNSLPMTIAEGNISKITLTGIKLLPLLTDKRISLDSVIIRKIKLTRYNNPGTSGTASKTGNNEDKKQQSFQLGYIRIDTLELVQLDSLDKLTSKVALSLETNDIAGKFPLTELAVGNLHLRHIEVLFPASNYRITVKDLSLDALSHLRIDSLQVIPLYNKVEFMRKAKNETDRFDAVFAYIEMEGIDSQVLIEDRRLDLRKLSASFVMSAYRDKRMRDANSYRPLPDSLLRALPIAVNIDSVKIIDSDITYEEVAEKADSAGTVTFKKLNATLAHVSNRDTKKAFDITASANFMDDGVLEISGHFSNVGKSHYMEGSLKNFRLSRLNRMLKPAVGIAIESGTMQSLKFSMWYNDHHSDGKLTMDYHDLKLLSFREKDDKAVPNVLKTALLNAFVANDVDKNNSANKRDGEIHFVRDREKFIFNYWWKSLLSGMKSAAGVPDLKGDEPNT